MQSGAGCLCLLGNLSCQSAAQQRYVFSVLSTPAVPLLSGAGQGRDVCAPLWADGVRAFILPGVHPQLAQHSRGGQDHCEHSAVTLYAFKVASCNAAVTNSPRHAVLWHAVHPEQQQSSGSTADLSNGRPMLTWLTHMMLWLQQLAQALWVGPCKLPASWPASQTLVPLKTCYTVACGYFLAMCCPA
jgi:hypothetical protein